jgi:CheY-like chemotaxis protein
METSERPLIYLVDDDDDDKFFMKLSLEKVLPQGAVTFFSNGLELISQLEKQIMKLPDLVIMDLNMPVMCGLEALKKIRSHSIWKSIPVVMFSTSHAPEDIETCVNEGANLYLCKPAEATAYDKIVDQLTRQWLSCG